MTTARGPLPVSTDVEDRVTPLELFFDLVFVFGLTQVTGLMSAKPTWTGLGEGMLVLSALWWGWSAYAWLTNEMDTERIVVRLSLFASMGAMVIAALAAPEAFGDEGLVFGLAYLAVRLLHILLFAVASRDVGAAEAMKRLSSTAIPAPALLLLAAAFDDTLQALIWIVALAIDFAGPYVRGVEGFRISPAYFSERYALVVIIALGESIVAVGTGLAGKPLDFGVVVAAALGVVVAASFWWAYFDVVVLYAERKFRAAPADEQVRMARDAYSYLHLPIIAGIVLVALGLKKAIGHVDEPLELVPAVALCGGVGVYLLSHVAFKLRMVRAGSPQRAVAAVIALGLIPVAHRVDAVWALALLAAVCVGLLAYEVLRYGDTRERLHAEAVAESR